MSLYALGDFHLSFQSNKSMKKFGSVWRKHEQKIEKYCNKVIRPEDTYEDYALVGTKGCTFEGPFYLDGRGRILGWDEQKEEHAKKLVKRELERLQVSFDAAAADGYQKFIMFLHYPPTSILETESVFTEIAQRYHVEHVVYSHCHGEGRFGDSIRGTYNGTEYHLVSGDYLRFRPERILE